MSWEDDMADMAHVEWLHQEEIDCKDKKSDELEEEIERLKDAMKPRKATKALKELMKENRK